MTRMIQETEAIAEISDFINSKRAELEALEAISINTAHKALTNKAVSGAEIRPDYSGYPVLNYNFKSGGQYHHDYIRAYEYGSQERILPVVMLERLEETRARIASNIKEAELELERVGEIVDKSNELREIVDAFNASFTYAGIAKIRSTY